MDSTTAVEVLLLATPLSDFNAVLLPFQTREAIATTVESGYPALLENTKVDIRPTTVFCTAKTMVTALASSGGIFYLP